jgi:hypothetical protein
MGEIETLIKALKVRLHEGNQTLITASKVRLESEMLL